MPQEGYDYDPDNDKKIWKIEKNIVSLYQKSNRL